MEIPFISSKLPNSHSPLGKSLFSYEGLILQGDTKVWKWISTMVRVYTIRRDAGHFQYIRFTWHQEQKRAADLCMQIGLNVMYSFLIQTIALLKYLYLNWNQFIVNYIAISVRANMHTHYRKKLTSCQAVKSICRLEGGDDYFHVFQSFGV